jgi:hypothetical protein
MGTERASGNLAMVAATGGRDPCIKRIGSTGQLLANADVEPDVDRRSLAREQCLYEWLRMLAAVKRTLLWTC